MKALCSYICRQIGYVVIALGIILPIFALSMGSINDDNLGIYKEIAKFIMMIGVLMIIFSKRKIDKQAEETIRLKSVVYSIFLTPFYLISISIYRLATRNVFEVDTSSFLIFLIFVAFIFEAEIYRSVYKNKT